MTTRRLAAIMAGDIAGFSALMERDEEGTAARIRALRTDVIEPALARHHGRLVKTTGDGFLAEFASPVEAVRSALAIQDQLAAANGVSLRIGINLGDIIIEDDGDVLGDGVNIAARLEQIAEPGGIAISGSIHEQVIGKIERRFEDRGEKPVKNIARPVRVYTLAGAGPSRSEPIALPLPDKPSIAVLPFTGMGEDQESAWIADGIVEDITTALARATWLFVIAPDSSFTYKGRAVDSRLVSRELGVRYLLTGSVRRAAGHVRIAVQLVDAIGNAQLWAERYEGGLEDVFSLQDEITASVAASIEPQLHAAEAFRSERKPPGSLAAWDFVARAWRHFWQVTEPGHIQALEFLAQAVQIDPTYALAHGLMGFVHQSCAYLSWDTQRDHWRLASEHAQQAVTLDPNEVWGRVTLALVYSLQRKSDEALLGCEEVLRLNPNFQVGHTVQGFCLACAGQAQQALRATARAMRLNPRDPGIALPISAEALAHFVEGRYEKAVLLQRRALQHWPNFISARRTFASALGHLGRLDEARAEVAWLLTRQPDLTLRWIESYHPLVRREDRRRYVDGLRKAGLPE